MNPQENITRPSPKVPLSRQVAWGCGGAADNILYNGLNTLLMPIFNVGMGLDALKLGYIFGLPRLFDAVTDVVIGNISDNTKTRWGRRRPFILIGVLFSALFMGLLFNAPSSWSGAALYAYIFFAGSFFYIAYATFVIPYSALGFELTDDYSERTRVLAWRMYLGLAAGLGIPWLYKLSFVINANEVIGARTVAWIMAAVVIVLGLIPVIFVRESDQGARNPSMPFIKSLGVTFKNRSFLLLTGSVLSILLGLFLAGPFGLYLNIFYVSGGGKEAAANMMGFATTFGMFCGLAGLPVATWLGARYGKRRTALVLVLSVLVSLPTTWWLFNPARPWLQLLPTFVLRFSTDGAFLLATSMLADVCDEDELFTGLRREGIYSAALEFGKKCAIAFSTVVSGYVLAVVGFDAKMPMQTEQTLTNLRLGYIVILTITLGAGAICIAFFPLTHARAMEIRAVLDRRKAGP